MKKIFKMFGNFHMIKLTFMITLIYGFVLYFFSLYSGFVLIKEGPVIIVSVNPAYSLPIVLSLLFGPAAIWGVIFGTFLVYGVPSDPSLIVAVFFSNLSLALLPYFFRERIFEEELSCKTFSSFVKFEITAFLNSSSCALIFSWIYGLFGKDRWPMAILAFFFTINIFAMEGVIGPVLMKILYDPVNEREWTWFKAMKGHTYADAHGKKNIQAGYFLTFLGGGIGNIIVILVGFNLPNYGLGYFIMKALSTIFVLIFLSGIVLIQK